MKKKIVVIEDEEQSGKLIQSYLAQHNFEVIHVCDGISGLNMIQELEPNLVLMDLLLPRMHGAEICKTMKKESQLEHIPIIIMTSVYKKVIGKMQVELGVNECIEKPVG
ncbi:MAG: response regulator [Acidobacteria bacterium]|nr:response regulator [Acidobacteriota bacterium]